MYLLYPCKNINGVFGRMTLYNSNIIEAYLESLIKKLVKEKEINFSIIKTGIYHNSYKEKRNFIWNNYCIKNCEYYSNKFIEIGYKRTDSNVWEYIKLPLSDDYTTLILKDDIIKTKEFIINFSKYFEKILK